MHSIQVAPLVVFRPSGHWKFVLHWPTPPCIMKFTLMGIKNSIPRHCEWAVPAWTCTVVDFIVVGILSTWQWYPVRGVLSQLVICILILWNQREVRF
jgi:hypothetical protein